MKEQIYLKILLQYLKSFQEADFNIKSLLLSMSTFGLMVGASQLPRLEYFTSLCP